MILRRESLAGMISVVAEYCRGRVNFVNSLQKFGFINGVDKCKLATVQRF